MTNPNVSEIISTTYKHRDKKLSDSVEENNAFLYHLKSKNKIRKVSGGHKLNQPITYAENSTAMWYSGVEVLNNSPSDVVSSAEYDWTQSAVAVVMSGLERLQNSGKEQFLDLFEIRLENAEKTLANLTEEGLFSDGTGTGGKQLDGLQSAVADAGSGNVGGIDSSTYTWWQNQVFDVSDDGSGAASASNIQDYMNALWMQLVRGKDTPDLLLGDNNYWGFYHDSLTDIQRITNVEGKGVANAGFQTLFYKGSPFVLAGGKGGSCPANHIYMLNCDHIFFKAHKDRYFTQIGGEREPTNQDASVAYLGFAGNLCVANRSLQGVLVP